MHQVDCLQAKGLYHLELSQVEQWEREAGATEYINRSPAEVKTTIPTSCKQIFLPKFREVQNMLSSADKLILDICNI